MERDPVEGESRKLGESSEGPPLMLRSILSNWVGMAVVAVTTFVLTPIFIHGLGDLQYGMLALLSSLFNYYGLLDLGLRPTVQRFVARFKGQADRDALNETLTTALLISLGFSLTSCLATAVLVWVLPDLVGLPPASHGAFRWLIVLVGANVVAAFPARLLGTCLIGFHRFDLFNLATIVITILRGGLQILALHLGFGLIGITAAGAILEACLLPIHVWMLRIADPEVAFRWQKVSWGRAKELASFGLYAFVNNVGDYLRFYINSFVIARILGVATVTPFTVATRLVGYFKMGAMGLLSPLYPRMSELEGQGKQVELRETFLSGTRLATVFSLYIGALLFFDGTALLGLWVGERFTASHELLMVLTVGYVTSLSQWPSSYLLYAKGRHKVLCWWTLAEGVANLVLSVHWAHGYGLLGVAWGTTAPMLVTAVLVVPWYVRRQLDLPIVEYVRRAFARPVAVTILFVVVALVAPSPRAADGVAHLAMTVTWQTGVFALLTYAIGLSRNERRSLAVRCGAWWRAALLIGSPRGTRSP